MKRYKPKFKPLERVRWTGEDWPECPFTKDEVLLCLGEIVECPGHIAVVSAKGQVHWMWHDDEFTWEDSDLIIEGWECPWWLWPFYRILGKSRDWSRVAKGKDERGKWIWGPWIPIENLELIPRDPAEISGLPPLEDEDDSEKAPTPGSQGAE